MINSDNLDFSFSGLKAEASRYISQLLVVSSQLSENQTNEICYAVQKAIFDVLVKKTLTAAQKYKCKTILLGGGVSANETLKKAFEFEIGNFKLEISLSVPGKKYATDNGAMIGAYAALNPGEKTWKKIESRPDLYFA